MADREVSRKMGDAALTTLRNLGLSDSDTQRLWNGEVSISLRDHRAQMLLMKAARYDEAVAAQRNAMVRDVPPVQRPGAAGSRSDDYSANELADLGRRLGQTGNVKDAARLLLARRANRG
jgi:hypothetical protein